MNRTQAASLVQHMDIIKAYADGAKIQFFCEDSRVWEDTENPMFIAYTKYRVKPVEYRELTLEELFELMKSQTIVYHKDHSFACDGMTICLLHRYYVKFQYHDGHYADGEFSYSHLKNEFVFEDGTPVAAKV